MAEGKDNLDALYAKMDDTQKQVYLMLGGMLSILVTMDDSKRTFIHRHELVEMVNHKADEKGILEAIVLLSNENGIPL